MSSNKQICRLCLEIVLAEDGEAIEETKLAFLLIHIDLNITDNAIACNKCVEQLQNCFDFKASCFYVDDYIAPLLDAHTKVDIKTAFERKLGSEANVKMESVQICRLCMSPIEDNKAINYNTDLLYKSDMIENCLPEVDLNTVFEPLICELCLSSMERLNDFMKTCQDVEQRIQNYYRDTARHGIPGKITLHDLLAFKDCDAVSTPIKEEHLNFDVKECPENEDISSIVCEEVHIKEELDNGQCSGNKDKRFKCQYCDYISKKGSHLKKHISSIHKSENTPNVEKVDFNCCRCPYKCKRTADLKKHLLAIHGIVNATNEATNNKKEFVCHYCDYKSKQKSHLKRHISAVHESKNMTDEKIFSCHSCDYKSIRKHDLKSHISQNHESESAANNAKLRECHYCDYKTRHEICLIRHVAAIHERDSATVHHCPQCTFKTVHGSNLLKHLRRHGERHPHKCPRCNKEFIQKSTLDDHLLRHHDDLHHLITSKVHHCEFCAYKSVSSTHFKDHTASVHSDSLCTSGSEKLRCHNCDFVGFTKRALRQHLLVHVNLRPHRCSSCEKGFCEKRQLDSHILNNHKEDADLLKSITSEIRRCTICHYETIFNNNLNRHMKQMHK